MDLLEVSMFYSCTNEGYKEIIPGIRIKTLTFGEKTLMSEFRLNKGVDLPSHSHPYEQTGYLISGELLLTIAGESYSVKKGDSWNIPGEVPHNATAIEDSVALEVFSPVREDYLPENLQ